ncbi:MAG: hypothetical protein PHV11_04750 [Candidatus Bipolaricaulis sp.]|nr:hypothetical protein [Candidatus Bipolaricaulis sp.]
MRHLTIRAYALLGLFCLAALLSIGGCGEKKAPSPTPSAPTAVSPRATETPSPSTTTASPAAQPSPGPEAAAQPISEPVFLAPGQVLAWKRGGTTSSLCDRLTIYADGRAVATTCQGQTDVERGSLMLSDAQRNQLNEWLRALKQLDVEDAGSVSGTAVPSRVAIAGSGSRDASPSDLAALRGFAAALFEQAVRLGLSAPAPSAP